MNKINRKLEYALIALKHMKSKSPGELSTAKEISVKYALPFDATAKVMQILAQKQILRSEQGVGGGYQLVKDLSKFSFGELMSFIVGPVRLAKCLHKEDVEPCEVLGHCSIVSPIMNLNRKLDDFYNGIFVGELLDSKTRMEVYAK